MAKRRKTGSWKGQNLLEIMLKNHVQHHIPRRLTKDSEAQLEGDAMVVQVTDTLPEVLRKLSVEGFTACPVVDGKRYVGFISMLDLVQYTCSLFWGSTVAAWVDFFDKQVEFKVCTIKDVIKKPSEWFRDPAPPMMGSYSTLHACEVMAIKNLHRMAVLRENDPGMRVSSIFTQSMMISFLRQKKKCMPDLMSTSVADMMDPTTEGRIVSCNENENAINAFRRMAKKGVRGLPILDNNGFLVGSLSVRDLRGVGYSGERFFRLFSSVKNFKKWTLTEFPRLAPPTHFAPGKVPTEALFVRPTNTFEDVLDKMADGNIHRIYVCPIGSKTPIAVIAQTDMLRQVLKSCEELSSVCPARLGGALIPAPTTTTGTVKIGTKSGGQSRRVINVS